MGGMICMLVLAMGAIAAVVYGCVRCFREGYVCGFQASTGRQPDLSTPEERARGLAEAEQMVRRLRDSAREKRAGAARTGEG